MSKFVRRRFRAPQGFRVVVASRKIVCKTLYTKEITEDEVEIMEEGKALELDRAWHPELYGLLEA